MFTEMFTRIFIGNKGEDAASASVVICESQTDEGRVFLKKFYKTVGKIVKIKNHPRCENRWRRRVQGGSPIKVEHYFQRCNPNVATFFN